MSKIGETMRAVQGDCENDATVVDTRPFSALGVGTTFGETFAMIAAVARAVELLDERVEGLARILESRTEHLL